MPRTGSKTIGLILAALAAAAPAGCGQGPPQEFASNAGRIRVVFPPGFSRPQAFLKTRRYAGQSIDVFTVVSQGPTGTAVVSYCDLPAGTAELSAAEAMRDAVAAFDGRSAAPATAVTDQPGMSEAVFSIPSRVTPLMGRARTTVDRGRMFQFVYLAASESELRGDDATAFFTGARVLPPTTQGPPEAVDGPDPDKPLDLKEKKRSESRE
jgi:hypothetical protein